MSLIPAKTEYGYVRTLNIHFDCATFTKGFVLDLNNITIATMKNTSHFKKMIMERRYIDS